jgi:chorismate mutase / prephenate dehydratase
MKPETQLSNRRSLINMIDAEILRLLNRRAEIATEIGKLKRELSLPYHSPRRERDVLSRLARKNPGPFRSASMARVFRLIMLETRRLQEHHLGSRRRARNRRKGVAQ